MNNIQKQIYNHLQSDMRDLYIQILFSRNFWEMVESNYGRDNTSDFMLDVIYKVENEKDITNDEVDKVSNIYQDLDSYIFTKPHSDLDIYIDNIKKQLSKYDTYNVVFDYSDLDGILSYLTLKKHYKDKVKIQGIIQRQSDKIYLHVTKDFNYLYDTRQLIVLDFELPYQFNISNHNILITQNINSNARLRKVGRKYPGNTVYILKHALNDQEIDDIVMSCDGMVKNSHRYRENFIKWFPTQPPYYKQLNPKLLIESYKSKIILPDLSDTIMVDRVEVKKKDLKNFKWSDEYFNIQHEKNEIFRFNILNRSK